MCLHHFQISIFGFFLAHFGDVCSQFVKKFIKLGGSHFIVGFSYLINEIFLRLKIGGEGFADIPDFFEAME